MITVFFPAFTPYMEVREHWSKRTNNGLDTWFNNICANPQTGLSYYTYQWL